MVPPEWKSAVLNAIGKHPDGERKVQTRDGVIKGILVGVPIGQQVQNKRVEVPAVRFQVGGSEGREVDVGQRAVEVREGEAQVGGPVPAGHGGVELRLRLVLGESEVTKAEGGFRQGRLKPGLGLDDVVRVQVLNVREAPGRE